LKLAKERGLDLVVMALNANPPVCRIADLGKLKYEQSKKDKEARKGQKGGLLKEVKLSTKIAEHDFNVRLAKARECLLERNKVKLSMYFRGREMAHMDLGRKVMDRMIEQLADIGKAEGPPLRFGKTLIILVAPK
jgi:translation initiation factor IF-3